MPRNALLRFAKPPRSAKFWIPIVFFLTLITMWLSGALGKSFSTAFLPHGFCYDWDPRLVWTHVIADLVIAVSYLAISTTLAWLVYRCRGEIPFSWILVAFGTFIIACGGTHLVEVITLWKPYYWLSANIKIVTAIASLTTAIALPPLVPHIVALLRTARLSEERRRQLEQTYSVLEGEFISQGQSLDKLAQDIAVRNRELLESTQRLYTTLTSIGDGVIATNAEGEVTFMNTVAERLTGWSLAEAAGQPLSAVFRIVNEITRQAEESPFEQVKRTGRIVTLANNTILLSRDGREIGIDDSGAPIMNASGELTGVILTFHDITDRRAAEEARRLLASIVDSSQDAIISRDLDGIITSWNKGAEKLYGYAAEEVLNKPIAMLLPSEPAEGFLVREQALLSGDLKHLESKRKCKDGRVIDVFLTISPILDNAGRLTGIATIGRDVTGQKQAQEALRTSEKLAATGRMAATIAHEINNPLEAVMNLLYLIETTTDTGDGVRNLATQAQTELDRVAHIARQTLAFYRDSTRPGDVDLREIIESLLDIYKRDIYDKGLAVRVEIEDGLTVHGFAGELRQVFANLIRNAVEAMQSTGTLLIRGLKDPDGSALITVSDTGPGVPASLQERIFEPFFTTKGVNGTGLGLWVTQGIVQKHGGEITVTSPPSGGGSGAEFTIRLPNEKKVS
jgi:PAS domain S-box-containing protein